VGAFSEEGKPGYQGEKHQEKKMYVDKANVVPLRGDVYMSRKKKKHRTSETTQRGPQIDGEVKGMQEGGDRRVGLDYINN